MTGCPRSSLNLIHWSGVLRSANSGAAVPAGNALCWRPLEYISLYRFSLFIRTPFLVVGDSLRFAERGDPSDTATAHTRQRAAGVWVAGTGASSAACFPVY